MVGGGGLLAARAGFPARAWLAAGSGFAVGNWVVVEGGLWGPDLGCQAVGGWVLGCGRAGRREGSIESENRGDGCRAVVGAW